MDKLSLIVNKRLNQHKLGDSARAAEILHQASRYFQKKLQCSDDEVKAFRLKDGVLYIGTAGAGWSQEVFLRQEALIQEVCKKHGPKAIVKLVIKS